MKDTLTGTLKYGGQLVAMGTMGYKHESMAGKLPPHNSVRRTLKPGHQRCTLCSAMRRQFVVTKSGLPSLPVMDLVHISLICLTISAGIGT